MKIGDRLTLTKRGMKLAVKRGLDPAYGTLKEIHRTGQLRVQRPNGGNEWWPRSAWVLALGPVQPVNVFNK